MAKMINWVKVFWGKLYLYVHLSFIIIWYFKKCQENLIAYTMTIILAIRYYITSNRKSVFLYVWRIN
ncbi:hypothetical protein COM96_25655 [Bacillus cereus]|uniref:Uncharacterized protein n=1 Tax=Bacillus cereus TaxID=1396 RepID=A0A2A7HQS9_BACCE|nr:hypothetical protein COM96_25655 [Bacillus cereus]